MVARHRDRHHDERRLDELVEVPARARTLYKRGGFEGLEPNVLQTLVTLYRRPDRTVKELAEELALRQPTVSTGLARLRDRGLAVESADSEDARKRRQRPTDEGRALVRRFLAHSSEVLT